MNPFPSGCVRGYTSPMTTDMDALVAAIDEAVERHQLLAEMARHDYDTLPAEHMIEVA